MQESLNAPSSRYSTATRMWFLAVILLGVAILIFLLTFQQGAFLQMRAFSGMGKTDVSTTTASDQDEITQEDTPINTASKLEMYCQRIKQGHVTECGDALPEDNHNCRTAQADQEYKNCLIRTQPEQIDDEEEDLTNQTNE